MTDATLTGELLSLRYVALDDALAWLWSENPKLHDLASLEASIERHGFRDPSIFDGTLSAISAGNGRIEALGHLRERGVHVPRGVALDDLGTWHVPTVAPGTSTDHPTSKPVELFAIPIQQHTFPGEICYEPFAGSGTQFVAAEQLGRLTYGIELQAEFVAVILERLSGMGLEPVLAGEE